MVSLPFPGTSPYEGLTKGRSGREARVGSVRRCTNHAGQAPQGSLRRCICGDDSVSREPHGGNPSGAHAPPPLRKQVFDACFHLAAATSFQESNRAQTFRANVDGTRNLLGFLKTLPRPGRFYHFSTTYICGIRPGEVLREELVDPATKFSNPYGESKHASEWIVARSGLQWNILRLSILMGDSRTGAADSDKMFYRFFRVYWRLRGVLRNKYRPEELGAMTDGNRFVFHGYREIAKNVICMDDAIRLLLAVVEHNPEPSTVFHVSNPRTTTMGMIHDASSAALGLKCLVFKPELPATLRIEETIIERGMDVYRPYMLNDEPVFDQTRLRDLVGDETVDSVLPVTLPLMRFFLTQCLQHRLECSLEEASDAAPGLDRLAFVTRHGRSALAYSSLRPGILALPVGNDGYVPWALHGRTAIMLGDPITAPGSWPAAVAAFLSHCTARRLRPVAVQVTRPVAAHPGRSEPGLQLPRGISPQDVLQSSLAADIPILATIPGGR